MTQHASEGAAASNPSVRLVVIAGAHHHVLLEKPEEVTRAIQNFVATL